MALGRFVKEGKKGECGACFPACDGCGKGTGDEDAVVRGFGVDCVDGFLAGFGPADGAETPGCF